MDLSGQNKQRETKRHIQDIKLEARLESCVGDTVRRHGSPTIKSHSGHDRYKRGDRADNRLTNAGHVGSAQ